MKWLAQDGCCYCCCQLGIVCKANLGSNKYLVRYAKLSRAYIFYIHSNPCRVSTAYLHKGGERESVVSRTIKDVLQAITTYCLPQ